MQQKKLSSRLRLVGSFQERDPNTPNDSMVNEAGDNLTQQKLVADGLGWVSSNKFIESPCGRPNKKLAKNGRASKQGSEWVVIDLLNLHVGGQSEPSTNQQRMMQDGCCVDRKHFFILFYPIANHDGWLAMYQPSIRNYLTSRHQPIALPYILT
jgi:hypothetical protein